jgi:CRISPR type I-E-associated protein CasB/Cse2
MPKTSEYDEKFIDFLKNLCRWGQGRADLRSGWKCAGGPTRQHRMDRFVEPWLPKRPGANRQAARPAFYVVAALYAHCHPHNGGGSRGNLGEHLARAGSNGAAQRHLAVLLAADDEDMAGRLFSAANYLQSQRVSINWAQLLADLKVWYRGGRARTGINRLWGQGFSKSEQKGVQNND